MANTNDTYTVAIFSELYKEAVRGCDALKMADCLLQSTNDLCNYKDDK